MAIDVEETEFARPVHVWPLFTGFVEKKVTLHAVPTWTEIMIQKPDHFLMGRNGATIELPGFVENNE